ncbi:MAG: hypothetical protein HMLKMBBP_02684 [Planctomycetes bacterium]|nr:hypothetical protein [Planctomycetota bacterium]
MPQPNRVQSSDFLVRRAEKADAALPATDGTFTWFGPVDAPEQRYRFVIVRDSGAEVSVVPGSDAKFKVGLKAWRWKGPQSEDAAEKPGVYLVVKTTARRVDLKKV